MQTIPVEVLSYVCVINSKCSINHLTTMKNLSIISLLLVLTFLGSCKTDDPVPENPEELITTLNMVFTPHGGGTSVTFQFQDLDGDGGNPPLITGGNLTAQTEYHATLVLLNESVFPIADITEEILDEAEDHQFFFQTTVLGLGTQLLHSYDDMDSNGFPIGIVNTFTTHDPASGILIVTLRHKPNKTATGIGNGDITNAGGETDIEVEFPVMIQ